MYTFSVRKGACFFLILFQLFLPESAAAFRFPFEYARIKRTPQLKTFSFPEGRLLFSLFPEAGEQEQKLQIKFISAEKSPEQPDEPVIVCLFDVSSSMKNYEHWQTLLAFIRELIDYKKPQKKLDFIFYSDMAKSFSLHQPGVREGLYEYMKNLSAQGGTNLELAFESLGQRMEFYGNGQIKKAILFSDGRPTLGRVDFAHFQEVSDILQSNHVEVDVFYTGVQGNTPPLLMELVKNTGGTLYDFSQNPRQLLNEIQAPLVSKGRLKIVFPGSSGKDFFIPLNPGIWTEHLILPEKAPKLKSLRFELYIPDEGFYKGECDF